MSVFINSSIPSSQSSDSEMNFSANRRGSLADSCFSSCDVSTTTTAVSSPVPDSKHFTPILDLPSFRQADDTTCDLCSGNIKPILPLPATDATITGRAFPINATRDMVIEHLSPLLSSVANTGRTLKIVGLLMSADAGCEMYSKMTGLNCGKLQVDYEVLDMQSQRNLQVLQAEIKRLNEDMSVDGLIFYTPCFGFEQDKEIRSWISPRIDVEGFHPSYWSEATRTAPPLLSELTTSSTLAEAPIYPCTPLAVVRALQLQGLYNISAPSGSRLAGKVVTVVNRSDTVGLPLASMFVNEGALVFSIDISSTQIWETHNPSLGPCISTTSLTSDTIYSMSDVVISAVPSPSFKISTKSLKPGVVAINVASGTNNFEADVKTRASKVAERMGSLTVMMLVMNALALRARYSED